MDTSLMENIFKYATAVISVLVFLLTAVSFVANQVNKRHKRLAVEDEAETLKGEVENKSSLFDLVNELIPVAIENAEKIPMIDGKAKKLLAMSEVMLNCNERGINFEDFRAFVSSQIEKLIDFTKNINQRPKDVGRNKNNG